MPLRCKPLNRSSQISASFKDELEEIYNKGNEWTSGIALGLLVNLSDYAYFEPIDGMPNMDIRNQNDFSKEQTFQWFNIYPNPTNSVLQLKMNYTFGPNCEVRLMNALGQDVLVQRITHEANILLVDELDKGIYSVVLVDEANIIATELLIIE